MTDQAQPAVKKCFDNIHDLLSFLSEHEVEQCTKFVRIRSFQDYTKTLQELNFGKKNGYFIFSNVHVLLIITVRVLGF